MRPEPVIPTESFEAGYRAGARDVLRYTAELSQLAQTIQQSLVICQRVVALLERVTDEKET